jgi:hypothetical protein
MKSQLRKDSKRRDVVGGGLAGAAWCRKEFETINLGDLRLRTRFMKTAAMLGEQPLASINQACPNWKESKAAYRLFSNEKCTADEIRRAHLEATLKRVAKHRRVLIIQDTTTFNFNNHSSTEGLGAIGQRASVRQQSQGLWMHTALAVVPHTSSSERDGVPLGIVHQKIWARANEKKKRKPTGLPIESKESYKWIESLEHTIAAIPSKTEAITVCDREGDIYEFLHFAQLMGAQFLVRNNADRRLWPHVKWDPQVDGRSGVKPGNTLRNHLSQEPCIKTLKVKVPRKAGLYPERLATVEVRYGKVELDRPTWPAELTAITQPMDPVAVHAIWVKEINPPKEITNPDPETLQAQRAKSPRRRKMAKGENPLAPLEWLLLTNVETKSIADVLERVRWYEQRWQIESYHKVIKSGCAVERCRLQNADRLEKYIALSTVIAWRIHWMSLTSRRDPDTSAETVLSKPEWQALYCKIHKVDKPPSKPPTIYQANRWIAQLGGFLARKSDGEPGTTTLWRGWQRLHDITEDWLLFGRKRCG